MENLYATNEINHKSWLGITLQGSCRTKTHLESPIPLDEIYLDLKEQNHLQFQCLFPQSQWAKLLNKARQQVEPQLIDGSEKVYLTSKGRKLIEAMGLTPKPMKRIKVTGNDASDLIDRIFGELQ